MRIVISCIGTYGDVNPFIAVGGALSQRGHDVCILSSGNFRSAVEGAGLRFSAIVSAEEYFGAVSDPNAWAGWRGLRSTWGRLWNAVPRGYQQLATEIRPGETVLVGSTLALWVRIAQEKFGVPAATVHLSPTPLMSGRSRLVRSLADRLILDPLVLPDLNRFRDSVGLAPIVGSATHWLHSPERVICAFPHWFAAPANDWPVNSVCTDFPRLAPREFESLDPALTAFLDAGAPPLAFTPGSGMPNSGVFFERALAACAELQRRAVLITAFPAQLPAKLPSSAFHTRYVHYALLAPRVAAFVHHGGIGTLAQLLAVGTPQLITPFAVDQPDNAARATRLGIARRMAPQAPVRTWVKTLAAVLDPSTVGAACAARARAIATDRPGAERIADHIEALRPEIRHVA